MRAGMGEAWHGDSITLLTVQEAMTKTQRKGKRSDHGQSERKSIQQRDGSEKRAATLVLRHENKCKSQGVSTDPSFPLEKFTRICLQNPTHPPFLPPTHEAAHKKAGLLLCERRRRRGLTNHSIWHRCLKTGGFNSVQVIDVGYMCKRTKVL